MTQSSHGASRAVHAPDRIYLGGTVYLGGAEPTRERAVATRGDRIVAIGDPNEVRALAGTDTEIVDLAGGLLSPGFRDAHAHAVFGGLGLRDCSMYDTARGEECLAIIADFAAAHPEREWLVGGGWNMDTFPEGDPNAAMLDPLTGSRPAYMLERGAHSAWVNSAALRRAGIDRNTPDPADGRIGRTPGGEPNGVLYEGAMDMVSRLLPAKTQDDYAAGLGAAQDYLARLGIVGWQDALVGAYGGHEDPFETYDRADRLGELRLDVVGALWWDREAGLEQIEHLVAQRARANGHRFRASSVKLMLDGVVEAKTAAMVHPYHDGCGHELPDHGLSFISRDTLLAAVPKLDALGFQAHFHALGDQAVRDALDAVAAARLANGYRDLGHHIAHLQVIQPEDLPRFREVGAAANIQPLWGCALPDRDRMVLPQLGEVRRELQWLYGSLHASGAELTVGSDWNVSSPDPLLGMHVAVNRRPPAELVGAVEPFLPAEGLPLDAIWHAYTAGTARTCGRPDSGRIQLGMRADLVHLDRDPFRGDLEDIHAARVLRTTVGGVDAFAA